MNALLPGYISHDLAIKATAVCCLLDCPEDPIWSCCFMSCNPSAAPVDPSPHAPQPSSTSGSSCRTPPPFLLFNMSPSGNGASVPLDCPQCGQSFRRREHLSRHLDRHSGARAYACSICKKSFPRRCASPPFRHRSGYLLPMRAPTNELA